MPDTTHPYLSLTPDVVMDALASVGLFCDGRLLALSSYENRVYQLHLEDGPAVVVKFYRPKRWSEAQVLEEHAFSAELMAAEIPVIGPLTLNGSTLHQFGGFSFSVSPSRGGRPPELDDPEVLEWIGRFLARIHTVGAAQPFADRPALDLQARDPDRERRSKPDHDSRRRCQARRAAVGGTDAVRRVRAADLDVGKVSRADRGAE